MQNESRADQRNSNDYSEYLDTTHAVQTHVGASVDAKVNNGITSVDANVNATHDAQSTENVGNSMKTSEEHAVSNINNALKEHVNTYATAKETQVAEAKEVVTEEEKTESSRTTFRNPSANASMMISVHKTLDEYNVYFSIEKSRFVLANGGIRESFELNENDIDRLCEKYITNETDVVRTQLKNVKEAPIYDYLGRSIPRDIGHDYYLSILKKLQLRRTLDGKLPRDVEGIVKRIRTFYLPGNDMMIDSVIKVSMDEYQRKEMDLKLNNLEATNAAVWANTHMKEHITEFGESIESEERRAQFYQWMKNDEEILSKLILHRDLNPGHYLEQSFETMLRLREMEGKKK